ncbi:MAG TPA: hypothetical protein VM925_05040 [Labilithrix sp.]|nr:hypothetical protein [Labilithrix sp.]
MRPARTLTSSKVDGTTVLLARVAAVLALLGLPRVASAREASALHDESDPEELADIEEEAFGTRGLVRTRAETVSFDGKARSIELAGNVRVDSPPFHLRSQRITLSRTKYGIEAAGKGTLAFCPCLGTPVKIEFEKAIVAPPGELILKSPKLEIYGVPVLYLPWFWLRSDEKIGLLPPDIAYRGQDGLYAGGGVHLPWKERGSRQALDLRGGAYLDGGFVADARLRTPTSSTKIRYDRLPGARAPTLPLSGSGNADDGLSVDARGASHGDVTTVAWDTDVLRGRRGVAATTELDAAAKPWDRAAAAGSVRLGPIVAETGFRAVTRRGGDLVAVEASGPFAVLRSSGAITSGLTYDATVEGGAVRVAGPAASAVAAQAPSIVPDSVSYGRAEVGALAATTVGPFGASVTARGAGDIAAEGRRDGGDRAGTARVRLDLPLARAFHDDRTREADAHERNDPFVHVVDPFVAAAVLHARGNAILGSLPGRGLGTVSGTAPLAEAGVTSTLGRWGSREALEVTAAGGAAHDSSASPSGLRPLARARLSATLLSLGAQIDSAQVFGERAGGNAVVARARLGRADGVRVVVNVAARGGLDPILARALTDPSVESPAGFLVREGTTGGAGFVLPWARAFTTSAGVDGDATNRELVAARAGIELRDRCNCVTLRANGAHRIGRSGVDVWIAIDFATDR